MIESITFADDAEGASYEFRLPSLKGKTFVFKPGVNVIIGCNGCGKTSLFKVIQKLTWYHEKIHSYYGEDGDIHEVEALAERYVPFVTMRNDFTKSIFSMRDTNQINNGNFQQSMANFAQAMSSFRQSEGQNRSAAIALAIRAFIDNKDFGDDYSEGLVRDFQNQVVKPFRKKRETVNDVWAKWMDSILKFYGDNGCHNDDWTVLLDEPDKGLDVFGIEKVFNMLGGEKKLKYPIQLIAIVHNVALISRLAKDDRVNFIELSEGYLDRVKDFTADR